MDVAGSEDLAEQSSIGIVDIGDKSDADRRAIAVGCLQITKSGMEHILLGTDVNVHGVEAAKLGGVVAV